MDTEEDVRVENVKAVVRSILLRAGTRITFEVSSILHLSNDLFD